MKNIVYKSAIYTKGDVHVGDKYFINGEEYVIPITLNTLPYVDESDVIGREFELKELKQLFDENDKVILVNGTGGIGKTTLAKYFIAKHRNSYNYVAWININKNTLESFIYETQLVDSLRLKPEFDLTQQDADWQKNCFEILINRMRQLKIKDKESHNLLVIDNASEDIEHAAIIDNIALRPNWKVLVTSREKLIGFLEFELSELSDVNAKTLFYHHYNYQKDDSKVEEILRLIEKHTLLIEIISKLGQSYRWGLSEILDLLKKKGMNISYPNMPKLAHNKNQRIYAVVDYLIDVLKVNKIEDETENFLKHFSLFPSTFLSYSKTPEINLLEFLKIESPSEKKDNLTKNLNWLVQKGFLQWSKQDDTFRMHPIISDVVRKKYEFKLSEFIEYSNYINEKLKVNYAESESPIKKGKFIMFSENLIDVISAKRKKFLVDDSLLGEMMISLGMFYFSSGKYETALRFEGSAVKLCEDVFGQNSERLADALNSKAETLTFLEKYEESIMAHQNALAIRYKIHPKQSKEIAQSLHNLGNTYYYSDDYKKCLYFYKKSVKIWEKTLDNNHSYLAAAYTNIGNTYRYLGNFERSLFYHKKSLKIRLTFNDNQNPDLAKTFWSIAATYYDNKQTKLAKKFMARAIEIFNSYYEENHPLLVSATEWQDKINQSLNN
ncbi:MAG: tetratricopeptide repeat protein [Bacteroidia bacterium]